jgi:hypothetical protein
MDLPDKSQPGAGPPKKDIKQVATGVKQVKRPATKRFMDFLFAESPKNMGKKIGREVVVPNLKTGVQQAINAFINGMFWGGTNPGAGVMNAQILRPGMTAYNAVSQPGSNMAMAHQAIQQQSSGNYQDLFIPTQAMAESTLAQMYELLNMYRVVAVADLYEMVNINPAISDNAFGWTSLDGARIVASGSGFILQLPRPHQITSI